MSLSGPVQKPLRGPGLSSYPASETSTPPAAGNTKPDSRQKQDAQTGAQEKTGARAHAPNKSENTPQKDDTASRQPDRHPPAKAPRGSAPAAAPTTAAAARTGAPPRRPGHARSTATRNQGRHHDGKATAAQSRARNQPNASGNHDQPRPAPHPTSTTTPTPTPQHQPREKGHHRPPSHPARDSDPHPNTPRQQATA